MSATLLIENNPFFFHDFDKLCAICLKVLGENNSQSIFETIPKLEPTLTAFQVLRRLSNFNIEDGPLNMCSTCFHNTTSAYKFILMCNNAQETIQNYFEHQDNLTTIIDKNNSQETEEKIILVVADIEDPKPVESTRRPGNRIVKCKICHKMYKHSKLANHITTHNNVCTYCGKIFKMSRALKVHERIHTGERPYKCKTCDQSFADPTVLKNHYLVHTKEKHFQCELCHKGFGRKTHLTQHLISHEIVKKYECHFCGHRFKQVHSLRTHLNKRCAALKYPVDVT